MSVDKIRKPTRSGLAALGLQRLLVAVGAIGLALVGLLFASRAGPLALYNITPSEPRGWYLRTAGEPVVGKLVAFRPPAEADRYLRSHGDSAPTILKTVVATERADVCTLGGVLRIEGRPRASIADRDDKGGPLPHWQGCRRLNSQELFVFSDRVPNSFDSRYYGPIRRDQVVGVFRPLWTEPDRPASPRPHSYGPR